MCRDTGDMQPLQSELLLEHSSGFRPGSHCLLEGRRSRASLNGGKGACVSQFTDNHLQKTTLKLTEKKKKQVFIFHLPGVQPTNATKSILGTQRTKFPG